MAVRFPALCGALMLVAQGALAQSTPPAEAPAAAPSVSVELNAIHPRDGACQFVLVGQNGTETDIDRLVLEAVLFDTDGRVATMTLLDLQDLPAGRLRVRSFEIGGVTCEGVSRLLINGVSACEPEGCGTAIEARSATPIEVLQ
ncbi:hypothetical protein [Pararhodobacter sp.]|uniref:hypothetical protein n=1 Tax=Pararhodobacter sp. TaxID=2127056 RepID=UPI002FE40630|nr:hypothetical protein [Pseudomonadota bacterium]